MPVPRAANTLGVGVAPGCLTVENRTSDLVCYVYITQAEEGWGDDRLGPAEVIDPNSARHFHLGAAAASPAPEPAPTTAPTSSGAYGTWRVRLEDCSRRGVYQRDVYVGAEGAAIRFFERE